MKLRGLLTNQCIGSTQNDFGKWEEETLVQRERVQGGIVELETIDQFAVS